MDEVFIIDVIDLLGLDDLALIEQLQGNVLSGFFVFGNLHFTEPTLTKNSTDLVVFKLEFSNSLALSFLHGICLNIDYNQIENHFFFYNFFMLNFISSLSHIQLNKKL